MYQERIVLYEFFEVVHDLLVAPSELHIGLFLVLFWLVALVFHQLVEGKSKVCQFSILLDGLHEVFPVAWLDDWPAQIKLLKKFALLKVLDQKVKRLWTVMDVY